MFTRGVKTINSPNNDNLTELQYDILIALLRTGRRASVVAKDLTSARLNARQVASHLQQLAKRGLVIYIPSPAGSYCCLTADGRCRAEAIMLQRQTKWDLNTVGQGHYSE